jgi:magnesium-protoporphyrin IX monomethyl ester (oxidative) cyclase
MKISLIALPSVFPESEFRPHEGLSQNLGIAYLSAFAHDKGHSVHVVDAFAEGMDHRVEVDTICSKYYCYGLSPGGTANLIQEDTDIIGISCQFNSQSFLVEAFATEIKRLYPDKTVVLGGNYASSFPREALTPNIDIVVRGEGEIPLLNLLSGEKLSNTQGIIFRKGDCIVDNGIAPVVENMDTLPFPARHLLPMERYFRRSQRGNSKGKTISITTSRGCPFDCNFCSLHNVENNYARRWRARSPENVVREIRQLVEQYGDIIFEFEDDNILVDRTRAIELFARLAELKVKWAIHSGVMINLLDEEIIRLIKDSGCVQLNLALESGNNKVLEAMNKKVDLDRALEIVTLCNRYKVNSVAFLMIGYPGETKESFQETLAYLKKLRSKGLRKVAPFVVSAYRGTPLYELCVKNGYLKNAEDPKSDIINSYSPCITTEDFDEIVVGQWMDMVIKIFHPFKWQAKYYLRRVLDDGSYSRLMDAYRRFKHHIAALRLSFNRTR